MGVFATRASRVYEFQPSAGSSVLVKQYNPLLSMTEPVLPVTFDIELGVLNDIYIDQESTNSGGVGETQRTRTGFDWNYALSLSFPKAMIGGELALAFAQQLLGSSNYVWMQFFMGDPDAWPEGTARSFVGTRSLLGNVKQRFDVKDHRVIGLNIAGKGSSLLRAYYGSDPVWP